MGNAALLNGQRLMAPPQPQLSIATPINDTQMLVLAAAQMNNLSPADAVTRAFELTVEAAARVHTLRARIDERKRQLEAGQ